MIYPSAFFGESTEPGSESFEPQSNAIDPLVWNALSAIEGATLPEQIGVLESLVDIAKAAEQIRKTAPADVTIVLNIGGWRN